MGRSTSVPSPSPSSSITSTITIRHFHRPSASVLPRSPLRRSEDFLRPGPAGDRQLKALAALPRNKYLRYGALRTAWTLAPYVVWPHLILKTALSA